MELALALGIVRAGVDVLIIMGDALLAVSAIVLGASMFQRRGPDAAAAAAVPSADAAQTGASTNWSMKPTDLLFVAKCTRLRSTGCDDLKFSCDRTMCSRTRRVEASMSDGLGLG